MVRYMSNHSERVSPKIDWSFGESRKRGYKDRVLPPDDRIFTETFEFQKDILMSRFKDWHI